MEGRPTVGRDGWTHPGQEENKIAEGTGTFLGEAPLGSEVNPTLLVHVSVCCLSYCLKFKEKTSESSLNCSLNCSVFNK